MKNTIVNLIIVTAFSFGGAALAAEETGGKILMPAKPAVPASAVPAAKVYEPAQQPQPAAQPATAAKPVRSKHLDLRNCLALGSNAAIAKCARE